MLVPEAAMHKDDLIPAGKDKIRMPWKGFSVKAESEAHAVGYASNS